MEKREAKVLWSKSGKGSDTTRVTLPVSWIRQMGLTYDERELDICFDEKTETITLRKKEE
ncbi:MAG: AbrB/MazE/SpoVT family DNA-binding domain-containing protein [Cetobacterium sp.]|uniref:AbrB/MazE/SpoVT family DNA-binding domain-containing protein n=1 Tax=Cetobacterium sp. TaxID=2071632 RepID=UPI003EE46FAA